MRNRLFIRQVDFKQKCNLKHSNIEKRSLHLNSYLSPFAWIKTNIPNVWALLTSKALTHTTPLHASYASDSLSFTHLFIYSFNKY